MHVAVLRQAFLACKDSSQKNYVRLVSSDHSSLYASRIVLISTCSSFLDLFGSNLIEHAAVQEAVFVCLISSDVSMCCDLFSVSGRSCRASSRKAVPMNVGLCEMEVGTPVCLASASCCWKHGRPEALKQFSFPFFARHGVQALYSFDEIAFCSNVGIVLAKRTGPEVREPLKICSLLRGGFRQHVLDGRGQDEVRSSLLRPKSTSSGQRTCNMVVVSSFSCTITTISTSMEHTLCALHMLQ